MKAVLVDSSGAKKSEIELPKVFESNIREDIVAKCYEALKFQGMNPYSPFEEAGKRHSASGTISHRRHEWKGHYGKGVSRVPRKAMHRRGTQFYWIATEVSNTRGGRRAHPPKGIWRIRKINKKEMKLAMSSALAATASKQHIMERYSTIKNVSPLFVMESLPQKTKSLFEALSKMFGDISSVVFRNKHLRAGKGKSRGRKYKSNAGILLITSQSESGRKFKGIEVKPANSLSLKDIYPLGRLAVYTQKALEELK